MNAFDPTLELHHKYREFAKKNGIRFHFRGLGASGKGSTRNSYGNVHAKRLRTLAHILGDAKDVLLKVDCECCEWDVFSDYKVLPVLRRVRLLFVELHVSPTMISPKPGQVELFFTNMRNAGLYIWWLRHNPGYPRDQQVTPHLSGFLKQGACCYEMAFGLHAGSSDPTILFSRPINFFPGNARFQSDRHVCKRTRARGGSTLCNTHEQIHSISSCKLWRAWPDESRQSAGRVGEAQFPNRRFECGRVPLRDAIRSRLRFPAPFERCAKCDPLPFGVQTRHGECGVESAVRCRRAYIPPDDFCFVNKKHRDMAGKNGFTRGKFVKEKYEGKGSEIVEADTVTRIKQLLSYSPNCIVFCLHGYTATEYSMLPNDEQVRSQTGSPCQILKNNKTGHSTLYIALHGPFDGGHQRYSWFHYKVNEAHDKDLKSASEQIATIAQSDPYTALTTYNDDFNLTEQDREELELSCKCVNEFIHAVVTNYRKKNSTARFGLLGTSQGAATAFMTMRIYPDMFSLIDSVYLHHMASTYRGPTHLGYEISYSSLFAGGRETRGGEDNHSEFVSIIYDFFQLGTKQIVIDLALNDRVVPIVLRTVLEKMFVPPAGRVDRGGSGPRASAGSEAVQLSDISEEMFQNMKGDSQLPRPRNVAPLPDHLEWDDATLRFLPPTKTVDWGLLRPFTSSTASTVSLGESESTHRDKCSKRD